MNRKRLLPILAIAAIALVVVIWAVRRANGGPRDVIRLSGNIELTQVDVAFKVPGRLAERPVEEGQAVKKGMLIARLSQEQVEQQVARERAGVTVAESQMRQMRTAVELQKETLSADVALREAELRQAEARLRDVQAGARTQEIESAKAAVDEAAAEEQRATRDLQRAETLHKNDDISTAQYDQFRARQRAAAAEAKRAREQLALVQEGARKEEIEAARQQVARARAAVRLSQAASLELRRRQQELDTRRAETDRARAQWAVAQEQLRDTVASSPIDGVVLTEAAEVGQIVAAGTTIVTLGDIEHPWLRGYINETDLGRVKIGARVRVTTDSFPGKVYWGRVSFIASEAEFTPKQIQTPEERVKLVYRVKIDIPNPSRELKLNMPVDAEILLNEK